MQPSAETRPSRVSAMPRFWRWGQQLPVAVTLLIVIGLVAWDSVQSLTAPSRLTPAVRQALDAGAETLNIKVTVGFNLEAFHMRYFQEQGQIVNVTSKSVTLDRVPSAKVRAMAHQYWIGSISLAEGEMRR